MTTTLLTKPETLQKLLAIEPATKDEAFVACGWPINEFEDTLERLVLTNHVTYRNGCGVRQQRMYLSTGRPL